MTDWKTTAFRAGLDALYFSGAHYMLAPFARGCGAIFTLHHVRAPTTRRFSPNRILEVSPDFLDAVIERIRTHDIDIVSIDEACRRLTRPGRHRRFVVFTFDDGYRDNLEIAYPIMRKHDAPFTVYVASGYIGGGGEIWWQALEDVIAGQDHLGAVIDGQTRYFELRTTAEKEAAYRRIYWWLRSRNEDEARAFMRDLSGRYRIDMADISRREMMDWDAVRRLAADPLVTIGAHTVNHYALARLPRQRALTEMRDGAAAIAERLGRWPEHFAYPYGDPGSAAARDFELAAELGFRSAVTTRKGVLFPEHGNHLTALPRISLNGDYQALRYLDLFLSGTPFAVFNRFRRLDVA